MGNYNLLILGVLSYIFGISMMLLECTNIIKDKKINMIKIVKLFYLVIYGITPGAIYTYVFRNGEIDSHLASIDFSIMGMQKLWIIYFISICAYVFLNLGFNLKKRKFNSDITNGKKIKGVKKVITDRNLMVSAIILSVIGFISLLLWTKVFGGPIGILPYANRLRAGFDTGIMNPFSFFMKFCQLSLLASYMFFMVFLRNKRKCALLGFVFSSICSFLYILANSSRMWFVLYFFILIVIYEGYKANKYNKKRNYIKYVGIIFACLIIMNVAEPIMANLQGDKIESKASININPMQILREEFFFPPVSMQTAIYAHVNRIESFRILEDIASGFFSWMPSRFRPAGITQLEHVNTILVNGTTLYGGVPPDIISVCIYDLGFFGVIIIPFLYGILIKRIEEFFYYRKDIGYYQIIYVLATFYIVKSIAYADFANIMANIFYVVVGHFVVLVVNSMSRKVY